MSITFPTTLDTLTNPTATDAVTSPDHAGQHSDVNDAVEALEAKIGINSSAVTSSLDYLLKSTSSTDPGHKHPASKIVNTPAGGIAATDIQTAINELDTEKASLASPTFTGTVTLPTGLTGIVRADSGVVSASTSPTATTIELGHATDTTISRVSAGVIAVENVTIADVSSAQTLTNKTLIATTNVIEEITATADSATPTPTGGSLRNVFDVTALAQAATFGAPSGTPANWNRLVIRIKDNGTARALSWNAIYVAGGISLPTTTVLSKILTLGFIYNTANSLNKWQLVASSQES